MGDQHKTVSDPAVGSGALLACPECGTCPMYVEERTENGMEATIQCQGDCNAVVGPAEWARNEWNRLMRANTKSIADTTRSRPR